MLKITSMANCDTTCFVHTRKPILYTLGGLCAFMIFAVSRGCPHEYVYRSVMFDADGLLVQPDNFTVMGGIAA